jgi:ribosome maturation factor RimP
MAGTGLGPEFGAKAEALMEELGLELVDLRFGPGPMGRSLQILVDKEGGASLDDCEKASRRLSGLVDETTELGGRFMLEVSSAGLERPLVRERDYERFKGREAKIKWRGPEANATDTGILEGLEGRAILLRTEKAALRIPLEAVLKARLVFHFGGEKR